MVHGLYDPDLDGDAGFYDDGHGPDQGPDDPGGRAGLAEKRVTSARRQVGDWLEKRTLTDLIGLGLLAGMIVSTPLVLCVRSRPGGDSRPDAPRTIRAVASRPSDRPVSPPGPRTFVGLPAPRPIAANRPHGAEGSTYVGPPLRPITPFSPPEKVAAPGARPLPIPVAEERVDDEEPVATVKRPPPVIRMGAVLEGIRRTTESTDWQTSGLADPGLMQSVRVILHELRRATAAATLGPPVWFGDLPPGLGANPEGVFHVAMSPAMFDRSVLDPTPVVLDAGRAFRSILIADGDIVLTSAEDCLILATGAVEVSYPTRCVVIAGRLIRASHDTASVLIAGSRLSVSHSDRPTVSPIRAAIYSAPELVSVGHAAGVVFLNSGHLSVSHQSSCRPLDWPALDFDDLNRRTRPFAWEGRLEPAPGSWKNQGGGFQLREKKRGQAIHVEIGRPILGPEDRPVPELEGWLAYRTTNEYAMLYKGRRLMDLSLDSGAMAGRRGR